MIRFLMLFLTACLICAPTLAHAQYSTADAGAVYLSTTSSSSTTVIAGGLVLTLLLGQNNSSQNKSLGAYLNYNRGQFEQDLALGAGHSLEELSSFFLVAKEDTAHFTRMMRRARKDIESILSDKTHVSVAQADALVALVHTRMLGHAALKNAAHRLEHVSTH